MLILNTDGSVLCCYRVLAFAWVSWLVRFGIWVASFD